MNREEWIRKAETEFFDIITEGKSLADLADCAFSFLGNPVAISNGRGDIIGTSRKNKPYNDDIWEEVDTKGYIPLEMRSIINPQRHDDEVNSGRIAIISLDNIAHRSMVCQRYINVNFLVRIVVLESRRPFNEYDEDIVNLFLKTVVHYLRNSELVRSTAGDSKEYFLRELILDRIGGKKDEAEIMSYLGLRRDDHHRLLIARSTFGNPSNISITDARDKLKALFSKSTAFLNKGYIVLLITDRDPQESVDRSFKSLYTFMRQSRLKACLSRSFCGVRNISAHYGATEQCLELGLRENRNGSVYFVEDMLSDYILEKLDPKTQELVCYPPIIELLEKDRQKQTKLVPTLFAYTLTLGNCTLSSKLLGISYNLMNSRLSQIAQVVGSDFKSILPALDLSLRILFLTSPVHFDDCFEILTRFRQMGGGDNAL